MHTCRHVLSTLVLCCQRLGTNKVQKRFLSPLPADYLPAQLAYRIEERLVLQDAPTTQTTTERGMPATAAADEDEIVDLGVPGQVKRGRSDFLDTLFMWRNERMAADSRWRPVQDLPRDLVQKIKTFDKQGFPSTNQHASWAVYFEAMTNTVDSNQALPCAACQRYAAMLKNMTWLHPHMGFPDFNVDLSLSGPRVHIAILQHRVYSILVVGVVPTDTRGRHASAIALARVGALPFPRDPEESDVNRWSSWCHKQGAGNDKKAVTKLRPLVADFGWRLVFASAENMEMVEAKTIAHELHSYLRENSNDLNKVIPHETTQGKYLDSDVCPRLFNAEMAAFSAGLAYSLTNAIDFEEEEEDVIRVLY